MRIALCPILHYTGLMGLVSELKRRNVLRMAVLYAVAAWLVMQVAEVVVSLAELPGWIGQVLLLLLVAGFPIALALSWFYELTPEGVSLENDIEPGTPTRHIAGRRLDFVVISMLAAAVILFAVDKWWLPAPPQESIAVLAFENMSDDPEQEYFSDGISEELLNALASIPELQVTSRSSAFSFKGQNVSIPEVAKQLNVAHVLEGSVRRTGSRVRITAQLIDAGSDVHVWSETYDRELDDIFAVQDEIASAISKELRVKLAPRPLASGGAGSLDMGTYDAYLKARELINKRDDLSVWQATQHLERALRLDDDYAPAHAQLAIARILLMRRYESTDWEEGRRAAIRHLEKAQALDPDLFDAPGGRALLALRVDDDPEAAIEHAEKALALNPSYIDALNWLQYAYRDVGRFVESDATLEQMLVLDPLSEVARGNYIERLHHIGNFEEAHEQAERLLVQNPGKGLLWHSATSLRSGDLVAALNWGLQAGRETDSFEPVTQVFMYIGERAEVLRLSPDRGMLMAKEEGERDRAIAKMHEIMRVYPMLGQFNLDLAGLYYDNRQFAEAATYYGKFLDSVPENRLYAAADSRGPIFENLAVIKLMRFAQARRMTGDETGAQEIAQLARDGQARLLEAGRRNHNRALAEAMIAAFDGDQDGALRAIESAIRRGMRYVTVLDDPIFSALKDEPRFVGFREQLEATLAADRDRILQLVCFDNPTPEHWQPLPETCEGVTQGAR